MLDRNQKIPLYEQLKNLLKNQIDNGELQSNEQLPSERELEELYNISRITVRQAIALAEKEGIITRVHGVGAFVSSPKIKQELNSFDNFQNTVEQLGLIASTQLLQTDIFSSDFQLSKLLGINVMDIVCHIQLCGYGDESPIVYYNSYFPREIGEKMLEFVHKRIEQNIPFSTLDLYHDSDKKPTHIEQTFESIAATDYITPIIKVEKGFPILKVTSIVYQGNIPLEYKESYYRGDKYKFFTTRKVVF